MKQFNIINSCDYDLDLLKIRDIFSLIKILYFSSVDKILLLIGFVMNIFMLFSKYINYYLINQLLDQKYTQIDNLFIYYIGIYLFEQLISNLLISLDEYVANRIYLNSNKRSIGKINRMDISQMLKIDTNRLSDYNLNNYNLAKNVSKILLVPIYLLEIGLIISFILYMGQYMLFVSLLIYIFNELNNIKIIFQQLNLKEQTLKLDTINKNLYQIAKTETIPNHTYLDDDKKFQKLNSKIFSDKILNKLIKSIILLIINIILLQDRNTYYFYLLFVWAIVSNLNRYDDIADMIISLIYGIKYMKFINLDLKKLS